jgi:enoyl-CoA hydratase/carnithine racemase
VAEAGSFTTIFARRGLISEHGTSWLLPRLIGTSRALDLLWSSRRVDAAEALRIGLADRVLANGTEVEAAIAYLEEIRATAAPRSIATMKQLVYRHLSEAMAPAFHEADARTRDSLSHPDAREGVDSFIERRPPNFAPLGQK